MIVEKFEQMLDIRTSSDDFVLFNEELQIVTNRLSCNVEEDLSNWLEVSITDERIVEHLNVINNSAIDENFEKRLSY